MNETGPREESHWPLEPYEVGLLREFAAKHGLSAEATAELLELVEDIGDDIHGRGCDAGQSDW